MHLAHYLGLLHHSQEQLARALREVASAHSEEHDVAQICRRLAAECADHAERLEPFLDRYDEEDHDEPERLHSELFRGPRRGGIGLLRDLQDTYLLAVECELCWSMIGQAAQGVRDADMHALAGECEAQTSAQRRWLRTRMAQAAPQALIVA